MKARIIAYYLPQFHPIPENDRVWGPGFTEWTNVAKARPAFRGHYQPRIPADLGFYDLRLPETREQQAKLAREAGIEGFCYWHYWFGNGRQLLERPFNEVLESGKPDFPFCLCWANHDWSTRTWQSGGDTTMIAQQLYPGEKDYTEHFHKVLPAMKDHRYITVDGKPLFGIYDPYHFTDVSRFIALWRRLAAENGLKGIHFVALCNSTTTITRNADGTFRRVLPNLESSAKVYDDILSLGVDGINSFGKARGEMISSGKYRRLLRRYLQEHITLMPVLRYKFSKVVGHFFAPEDSRENIYPTVMAGWDRTPRNAKAEGIYTHFTPEAFRKHILKALDVIKDKGDEHKILFLRSWNEWGEGNYVEPDLKYGHGFLEAIKATVNDDEKI